MKTDGERNRNLTSACGSASHCRCTTSARARASDATTPRCSTAFSGSRSRERLKSRDESG